MGFHRLVTPSYFGGLLAGYDLINTPTGPGKSPAQADGVKVGGPNEGTYFVGFGEDVTSLHFNRGLKALAQNTDALDDLFHRDLVLMTRTADVTVSGSPIMSVTLPAGTYLGPAGMTGTIRNFNLLFSIRDSNDRPILDTAGTTIIYVVSVGLTGGDAIGGGFSQNTVRLDTLGLNVGVTYRVYYGVRKNAATLDTSTLLNERAQALFYGHEIASNRAHVASAIAYLGTGPWVDGTTNPITNVEAQLDKIIADLTNAAGAARIGAAAAAGSPVDLNAGSIRSQLNELLGYINILNDYLNGTTTEAELLDAILTGTATAEDLTVSGALQGATATFAGAVHLLSTLIVDDDVTLNNTTHINGGNLSLVSAAFTATNSSFGLSNTPLALTNSPILLSGSSRIPHRQVALADTAAVTISVNSGDVFHIPDLSQNMTITINADSDVVNAWFRITTAMGSTSTFTVTIQNHSANIIATLKSLGASGSHFTWVDLVYGVHPVALTLAWLIEANYWKA
jgi:hypothetical protein